MTRKELTLHMLKELPDELFDSPITIVQGIRPDDVTIRHAIRSDIPLRHTTRSEQHVQSSAGQRHQQLRARLEELQQWLESADWNNGDEIRDFTRELITALKKG